MLFPSEPIAANLLSYNDLAANFCMERGDILGFGKFYLLELSLLIPR